VIPNASTLLIISDDNFDVASVRILSQPSSTSVVLGVFEDNTSGTGTPISTPTLTSVQPQIPILASGSIRFIGNGGDGFFVNLAPLSAGFDGGPGKDILIGGSGNDTFIISPGNDDIDGLGGTNTVQVQANGTITLTDNHLVSALGNSVLANIDRAMLTGGPGN